MLKLAMRFPFLTYALLCNIAFAAILMLSSFGSGYDDGGIGGIAFVLQLIWCGLAFPFFGPIEALQSVQQPWGTIVGWCIGLLICVAGETIVQWWRQRSVAV